MGTEQLAIPKPKSSAMSVQRKKATKSPFASRRSFSKSDNESTSDDFPVSGLGMELDWSNIPVEPPELAPQVQEKEETEKKDIQAKTEPEFGSGMELDWGSIPVEPPEATPQVQGKEETEKKDIQAKEDEIAPEDEEKIQAKEDEEKMRSIQTKLAIGKPGDKYEQEADRVARTVIEMKDPAPQDSVQRQPIAMDEEEKQKIHAKGQAPNTSADFENTLSQRKGGGFPLGNETKEFMESRFGTDFNGVRVHTDSNAVQMNKEVGAQAFTHGTDIFFNNGKYNPGSSSGKELLAHELTHVVQQTGGVQAKQVFGQQAVQMQCPACEVEEAKMQQEKQPLQLETLNSKVIQRLGEPLDEEAKVKPELGEEKGQQRKYSVEQYITMWEAEQGRKLTNEEKKTLERGCIGITALDLNGGGNPPLDRCYGSFEQAKAEVDKTNKNLEAMKTLLMLINPMASLFYKDYRAVLFAKLFWSNQSPNDEERKKPDEKAFKPDPKTGKVDMSKYTHYRPRAGGNFINFDYGFWDEASQSFWHANHAEPGMKVYQSTKEKFAEGYIDFDRIIYCVAIAKNYDPQKAVKAH